MVYREFTALFLIEKKSPMALSARWVKRERPRHLGWLYLQWSHKQPGQVFHLSVWLMHVRWWLWSRNMECCTFQRKCDQGSLSAPTSCLSVREQTKIPRLCLPQKVPSFSGVTETVCFLLPWVIYLLGLQLSPSSLPSPTLTSLTEQCPQPPFQFLCVCFVLQLKGIYLKFWSLFSLSLQCFSLFWALYFII